MFSCCCNKKDKRSSVPYMGKFLAVSRFYTNGFFLFRRFFHVKFSFVPFIWDCIYRRSQLFPWYWYLCVQSSNLLQMSKVVDQEICLKHCRVHYSPKSYRQSGALHVWGGHTEDDWELNPRLQYHWASVLSNYTWIL